MLQSADYMDVIRQFREMYSEDDKLRLYGNSLKIKDTTVLSIQIQLNEI